MSVPAPARIGGQVHGSAVVFVRDESGEVRVRWHFRRGWRCDADGASKTTGCPHVEAAVHALTAHLLTRAIRHASTNRGDEQP